MEVSIMGKLRKHPMFVLSMLFLGFSLFAGVSTELNSVEQGYHVEACRNGIVYLPPGSTHVRCNGMLKRIKRITPYVVSDESCLCPTCCAGECAVIVSCDAHLAFSNFNSDGSLDELNSWIESGGGGLCTVWLDCD